METEEPSITRRNFLRACTVASAGLTAGLHRPPFMAAASAARTKPPVGKIEVCLEIGNSKVSAAVGERFSERTVKLLGVGQAPSRGLTRWRIVDFEAARHCIREALVDAETQTDVMIGSVVLAVAGHKVIPHRYGLASERMFEWEEICYADRGDGVLRRVRVGQGRSARDCEIVFGAKTRILDTIRCVKDLGVEVERVIFAPVASAEAVLSANQKNLGALVIDIGEGTTDYAVYADGALVQSNTFAFGGLNIAKALWIGLNMQSALADKLAILRMGSWSWGERMLIGLEPGYTDSVVKRELLNTIIRDGVGGVFGAMKRALVNSGIRPDSLAAGVHLTGGCSTFPGICELAEEVFGIPAPRAHLEGIVGSADDLENPRLTCALGLLKLGSAVEG